MEEDVYCVTQQLSIFCLHQYERMSLEEVALQAAVLQHLLELQESFAHCCLNCANSGVIYRLHLISFSLPYYPLTWALIWIHRISPIRSSCVCRLWLFDRPNAPLHRNHLLHVIFICAKLLQHCYVARGILVIVHMILLHVIHCEPVIPIFVLELDLLTCIIHTSLIAYPSATLLGLGWPWHGVLRVVHIGRAWLFDWLTVGLLRRLGTVVVYDTDARRRWGNPDVGAASVGIGVAETLGGEDHPGGGRLEACGIGLKLLLQHHFFLYIWNL